MNRCKKGKKEETTTASVTICANSEFRLLYWEKQEKQLIHHSEGYKYDNCKEGGIRTLGGRGKERIRIGT
jgi:hypothetical protein